MSATINAPQSEHVLVAYPLPNGTHVLVPRAIKPRSCVRLDGTAKIVYDTRAEAWRGCPKHETAYRCRHCGAWHRATKKRSTMVVRETWPLRAAWIRSSAA